MGDSVSKYHDMTFYGDEQLEKSPEIKATASLSDKVKLMLLNDKTFTEKQTKKLTAFYDELIKENL